MRIWCMENTITTPIPDPTGFSVATSDWKRTVLVKFSIEI